MAAQIFTITRTQNTWTEAGTPETGPTEISAGPGSIFYPIRKVEYSEYSDIQLRNLEGYTPNIWYDDSGFPLRTIRLHPVPANSGALEVYLWNPQVILETLDTEIQLPPGYERYLKYKLALELAAEFGKTVTPELAGSFKDAEIGIKTVNTRLGTMQHSASARSLVQSDWGTNPRAKFMSGD